MNSKSITIKDIAKETGVSIASVSRALNGLSGISEETKNKILSACERLGYVPNTLARGLVLQRTHTIGFIVPNIASPFYSRLMISVANKAKEMGYHVLLCNSSRSYEIEKNYFNVLIGNQVEGILFFPVGEKSNENIEHFTQYIPIVSLNEMPKESLISYVCRDEYNSGKVAAKYLIKHGCSKLLYIGYTGGRIAYRKRVKGFLDISQEYGVYREVYTSESEYTEGFEQGYHKFCEFLSTYCFEPDGVVVSSDEAASGVLKACIENNIIVPDEISIISFDNLRANLLNYELTSVAVSYENYINKAIDILIKMKDKRNLSSNEKKVFITPEIFEGNTCKKK